MPDYKDLPIRARIVRVLIVVALALIVWLGIAGAVALIACILKHLL
jgi:hypothetical protein